MAAIFTGACILKGEAATDPSWEPKGSQGQPIDLAPGRTEVLLTFGYLRR